VTTAAIVCGDVHLGPWPSGFPSFLDRLAERPPACLVLLGDVVDYWIDDGAGVAAHRELFARLRRLRERGWRVVCVAGNRELAAGRRFAAAGRLELHWPAFDIATAAGPVRVVHGDRLCRDPGYHLFAACARGFWARALLTMLPSPAAHGIARLARWRSRRKGAAARARGGSLMRLDPARVRAAARGAVRLLAGHIHRRLHTTVGGVDLWLAGDWPGTEARWLEVRSDGGVVRGAARAAQPPASS
jgi:UDP-2,3-diacylglucosamine pyrophosphatase LpxH